MREAFSDSLLASAAIVSQPHPERKSVLVEVNALLLAPLGLGLLSSFAVDDADHRREIGLLRALCALRGESSF